MSQLVEIVQGWTGRLTFTAKADGVGVDLTGLTCTAQIRGSGESTYVDTAGDVTLGDQVATPGRWYLDPDAADFAYARNPYSIRLKVVDGSGAVVFFPNAVEPDYILVGRP